MLGYQPKQFNDASGADHVESALHFAAIKLIWLKYLWQKSQIFKQIMPIPDGTIFRYLSYATDLRICFS
jgi:hypothetical protein